MASKPPKQKASTILQQINQINWLFKIIDFCLRNYILELIYNSYKTIQNKSNVFFLAW